nr:ATP-dependent helicase HrpB [uncultured Anaeromusa sp.]
MNGKREALPIDEVLPQLQEVLRQQTRAVLVAPPGAGKTTRVPLALLDEPWLRGKRLLLLEPRRLAARAAARQMARLLGEEPGETVGWRMRHDSRISAKTRLEVITEGVLTRMLQDDASLPGIGAVLFDEFHERSLQADVGLAFCLQSQAVLRADLRLVVMSATLAAQKVAALLEQAPVIVSEGRLFPVAVHRLGRRDKLTLEENVAEAVRKALAEEVGDVLVFLPGAPEIRRTAALLAGLAAEVKVLPLYGRLSGAAQDEALLPVPQGIRKVVLATSLAETSLTVEGVRVVVDSGRMRVPRFSLRSGLSRLETVQVTADAALQRRGRAGRLASGSCYCLWTEREEALFIAERTPEVLESDLTALALELALWGVKKPQELAWLDEPPAEAFAQGRQLLEGLGALDTAGAVTAYGRRLALLGLTPRLGHMVLRGTELAVGATACLLAAFLTEGEAMQTDVAAVMAEAAQHEKSPLAGQRLVWRAAARYARAAGVPHGESIKPEQCGLLLALAFPERLGQNRGDGRFLLGNGRGTYLPKGHPLTGATYVVAVEVDDGGREGRIFRAVAVEISEVRRVLAGQIRKETYAFWDAATRKICAREKEYLGALVLKEAPTAPTPAQVHQVLKEALQSEGLTKLLNWTPAAKLLRQRLAFAHYWNVQKWPDVSEEALLARTDEWLEPFLGAEPDGSALQRLDVHQALMALVPWDLQRSLDEWAPTAVKMPSGRSAPIDYQDAAAPFVAVKLQEVFGWQETPYLAEGRVPLTMQLLSPAQRPVQVTRDLASFWRDGYFAVRKELAGRYPKHYWPEDPLTATPTSRVRPTEKR